MHATSGKLSHRCKHRAFSGANTAGRSNRQLRFCAASLNDQPGTPSTAPSSLSTQAHPAGSEHHQQVQPPAQPVNRRGALLAAAGAAAVLLPATSSTPAALAAPAAAPVARPFCGVVSTVPSWAFSADWEEGTVPYAGFQTWYRALGPKPPEKVRKARSFGGTKEKEADKIPLLVVHGGPGMPCRYLESLELLGVTNRRLVFYDQIGCGQSRRASQGKGPGLSKLTPDLFIQEIDAVREGLGLDKVHLVGHGWGGMLALAYVTRQAQQQEQQQGSSSRSGGVASLTLLSTPPSWEALVNDRRAKASSLGPEVLATLDGSDSNSAEYQEALRVYQREFVCRSQPVLPGCVTLSMAASSPSVSKALTGGNMFTSGGSLSSWSVVGDNLSALEGLPALVVRGDREELSRESTQALLSGPLAAAKTDLLELPNAGTMVHIDAHEALLERLDQHLLAADARFAAVASA